MAKDHITQFNFRDRVNIDGDSSISAVIVDITLKSPDVILYGVSYFHNGQRMDVTVEEWRLSKER